jgi:hypothetical protein
MITSIIKKSAVAKFEIDDIKYCLADLQTLHTAILKLVGNQNRAVEVLIDSLMLQVVFLDGHIKDCGGVGFSSIDDTLDFVYNLEHNE